MAVITTLASSTGGRLRAFDVRHDLNGVADLVELCFADTMDNEGQRYLKGMRDAARNPSLLNWASMAIEQPSLPLSGYVWEEDGRLVGNLSLIPFSLRGHTRYLIANVAVHPVYRRRGIARALTAQALEHARLHSAASAWLQVRQENDPAIWLYRSLGFQERARRTTWGSLPFSQEPFLPTYVPPKTGIAVLPGRPELWEQECAWLKSTYPSEIAWHLPLRMNFLRPGLWGAILRLFNSTKIRHWIAYQGEKPRAALFWQTFHSYNDLFWLATGQDTDDGIIYHLLYEARLELSPRRSLTLDYPAGQALSAIRAAGFQHRHTLIWMEAIFS